MGKRKKEQKAGAPEWMVTFADMMTLLLCFFVLLLSFSTISEEKFENAMMSLKGAFGFMPRFQALINPVPRPPRKQRREEAARRLQREMQMENKDKDVSIEFNEKGGLKIVLSNSILFGTAEAALKSEAFSVLDSLIDIFRDYPEAMFEVRGHTDSRPLRNHARFRDNHDLSYYRADSVARYMGEQRGIGLENIEITGCGASQPVATNETPEGMSANRRVEIYVRGLGDEEASDLQTQAEQQPDFWQTAPPIPGE